MFHWLSKLYLHFALPVALVFCTTSVSAQGFQRYLVPEEVIEYPHRLQVTWANDIFFQTDRYYTNGVEIEYHSQQLGNSVLSRLLFDPLVDSKPIYSLVLTHEIYTPRNVLGDPSYNDRPYAGVLLLGLKGAFYDEAHQYVLRSTIQAGLLGRYAGGQLVQNGIHVLLPASEPIPGWDFQIQQEMLLSYLVDYQKLLFDAGKFQMDALAATSLGLPLTDFSGGLRLRYGQGEAFFSPQHLLAVEGMQYNFFAEATTRYVVYDATLQGGAFNGSSPHTIETINPLLAQVKAGASFRYHKVTAEIGAQWVSAKFENALAHKWGYFVIGFLF
ncbi:MAG: lipid A deacylase LpxR family protein [Bacteroidales bacterium]|nr:lipid A deacylase LpxR family protein [Bacteroidales bacterium]NCU34739.1 lipid A deacylase LpxR family protein [Candidatus Falkowbacteria bacterium]MDD3525901.1 lipid A deacylase LpxR family protein [Bacteroidales bacterium]MDD4176128.1 lipid A deacylase LpxR family protein [Bacteroidales bacterium]MDD4740585.1 lipid A deacylase LpxR family protein [Bacteroidales bacterium]